MGSGFSSGKKTSVASSNQPVVVIDCSTDAELAAAIQQSEVDTRSRDLAVVAELQEMDQCIAESLIPDGGVAFELQQSEVAACNALLHEPPREERQHAEIANTEVQPNGGLTREQIELLPMSYYAGHGNGNNECKICFSDYKIDDLLRTLPCCHIFHSTCIDDWIKRSNNCPTCRKGIREELRIISPAPASVPRPLTPSAPPFYML